MPLLKNIISLTSTLWVVLNLLCGVAILIPVSILNWLIPLPLVSRGCFFLVDAIYRTAVKVDSFWMLKVIGIELSIKGELRIVPRALNG